MIRGLTLTVPSLTNSIDLLHIKMPMIMRGLTLTVPTHWLIAHLLAHDNVKVVYLGWLWLQDIIRMVTFGGGNITECSYRGVWNDNEGKIISPETKSRDLYSSRNIISNPKILGTFRDVPDNKVAICYIVWLPIAPIALPGFGIARRNLQNSVFFQRGFSLSCAQCNAYPLYCAPQCNAYPLYCVRNKKPVRG